jgi:hypothetical protein
MNWFKKYWKDLLYTVTAIFAVFYVTVFAGVWGDRNYESNFWPNFFTVSGIVVGAVLIVGWVILWTSKRNK